MHNTNQISHVKEELKKVVLYQLENFYKEQINSHVEKVKAIKAHLTDVTKKINIPEENTSHKSKFCIFLYCRLCGQSRGSKKSQTRKNESGTFSGAAGSRTRVQTRNQRAFYMLIVLLLVGKVPVKHNLHFP